MAGVKIGTVVEQRLNLETYFAQVTLGISESVRLPSDTSARIIPDGLLGGNYVALEPGGAEDFIQPGGRIVYAQGRSEEHTSELQSLMRISYAVFCLQKKNNTKKPEIKTHK